MKVATQNSKVGCRDLQKSRFMSAIAIFSEKFPISAKPPFRYFCVCASAKHPQRSTRVAQTIVGNAVNYKYENR